MGLHASDGLAGKVAAARSGRFVGVGTISAVVQDAGDAAHARSGAPRREAPGGFVGMNLMAAINQADFERSARIALEEGVSLHRAGRRHLARRSSAGAARPGTPFAGIVSSGRLAAMYEKWGAEFLVAEGAEAGGHIGDIDHPAALAASRRSCAHTSLPVVAAGGVDGADVARYFAPGARRGAARDAVHRLQRRRRPPDLQADAPRQERGGRHPHHELREGDEGARGAERVHRRARGREALPAPLQGLVLRQGRLPGAQEGLHRVPRRGPVQVPGEQLPGELLHPRRPAARP